MYNRPNEWDQCDFDHCGGAARSPASTQYNTCAGVHVDNRIHECGGISAPCRRAAVPGEWLCTCAGRLSSSIHCNPNKSCKIHQIHRNLEQMESKQASREQRKQPNQTVMIKETGAELMRINNASQPSAYKWVMLSGQFAEFTFVYI